MAAPINPDRSPKSPEQRRKISASLRAYQTRVREALAEKTGGAL